MLEENLTPDQIAVILRVSVQTVQNWCKKGKLPAFRLPGSRRWLVNAKDLEKMQKELRNKKV